MPEGPEVHTIADWIRSQVNGLDLIGIGYSETSRYHRKPLAGLAEIRLPLEIIDVDAKGKKIIFMLENDFFLISSLGMEGKWSWEPEKHSDLWLLIKGEDKLAYKLYFTDSRHFGTLEIITSREEFLYRINQVGPDLITDQISEQTWLDCFAKLKSSKKKPMKIGLFVMEQKYFSGIGNYLRAEILYAAKISPHRLTTSLSNEELLLLFQEARRIIRASYAAQGATLATYRDPHGGKGSFQVVVYNKKLDPLGNPVIGEDIGDKRTTHWVPAIQV